jgi:HK97 family phage portal protein
MNLFGLTITRTKAPAPLLAPISTRGVWRNVGTVREPYTGAWQQNVALVPDSALANAAVFSCITLIAADIAKLPLRLVAQDDDGVWQETTSAAFSPVLRKPNHYQTTQKFLEHWLTSKLTYGNTYVLKQRDRRQVVTALYVLDPTRVTPLVAQDGSVYYDLRRDDLSGLPSDQFIVPASEIIHDLMVALFHPLIGVSPIYACGLAAAQGLAIQKSSANFFSNGAQPGGILTAPGAITPDTAARLKEYWQTEFTGANAGKIAVAGDGLKYEPLAVNAVDAELINQLKWTADTICSCFHVPPYMIGVGPPPPYANIEPLLQQYYAQCLQTLMTALEASLDVGLGLLTPIDGVQYGTEFDVDDLIWMDTATRTKAAADAIGSGALAPDEARAKYFGLGPVPGGDSPYLQQQYYSLAALAARDAAKPFAPPPPAPPPIPADGGTATADLKVRLLKALEVRDAA